MNVVMMYERERDEYTVENRCVRFAKQLLAPQMRCFYGEGFQFNAVMVRLIGIFSATISSCAV